MRKQKTIEQELEIARKKVYNSAEEVKKRRADRIFNELIGKRKK